MKTKLIIIITLSLLNISLLNGQNWFKGSEWNFHFNRITSFPQFIHLGVCKTEGDTLIENKSFSIIKSNNNIIDYLYEQEDIVYYFKEQQTLKLFDFSKLVNDSFLIDMSFNNNQKDTIIKNVLVKIKSIDFIKSISTSDSLKSFKYIILSDNVKNVIGSYTTPFEVPNAITEKIILTNLAKYNTISLTQLFNPTVNLGMDSKPILSCFKNENSNFSIKDSFLIKNNFPCDYSTGVYQTEYATGFNIFPNPVTTKLNIDLLNYAIKGSITIYNMTSTPIKKVELTNSEIDITELPKGFYFIEIFTNNGKFMKKFIKE